MMMKTWFFIFAICNFCLQAWGQQRGAGILPTVDTSIENPLEMRDPFKKELIKERVTKKNQGPQYGDSLVNVKEITSAPLEDIKIVGVLLGIERRALARVGNDPDTYTIKEGMILGHNKGVVRAILPGGIVVVEELTNIYDQKEYLETVIPISH